MHFGGRIESAFVTDDRDDEGSAEGVPDANLFDVRKTSNATPVAAQYVDTKQLALNITSAEQLHEKREQPERSSVPAVSKEAFSAYDFGHVVAAATRATASTLCDVAGRVASDAASQAVEQTLRRSSLAVTPRRRGGYRGGRSHDDARDGDDDVDDVDDDDDDDDGQVAFRARALHMMRVLKHDYDRRRERERCRKQYRKILAAVRRSVNSDRAAAIAANVPAAIARNDEKETAYQKWFVGIGIVACVLALVLVICACVMLTKSTKRCADYCPSHSNTSVLRCPHVHPQCMPLVPLMPIPESAHAAYYEAGAAYDSAYNVHPPVQSTGNGAVHTCGDAYAGNWHLATPVAYVSNAARRRPLSAPSFRK